ncbi:MAG: DEAD/DEAH box helicase [Chloroflexota bacterium]
MSFDSFKLHPQVAAGVTSAGYVEPTPVQIQCIPPIMEGRDVMGLAQTGTGKTAAFVLPILHRLLQGPHGRVRALVIAPTRELAEQTSHAFTTLGVLTGLRSTTVYGGVDINAQVRALRAGPEIVVGCPGRLLDHMGQGTINLLRLEVLVLDEADRMFDMGFLPDVRRILMALPTNRQTLLFSATMPDDIRKLTREVMRNPVIAQINRSAPVETVSHAIYPVEPHLKGGLLKVLLHQTNTDSVLVFTRTKNRAARLAEQLARVGYKVGCIQGDLSQYQRQAALDGFRDGRFNILVATDIAARGIDVEGISHVINYDMPDTADNYIHRIGRTGRASRTGDAFTLVTRDDEAMVRQLERILGYCLERRMVEGFNYFMPRRDPPATHPPHRQPRATGRGWSQRRPRGRIPARRQPTWS